MMMEIVPLAIPIVLTVKVLKSASVVNKDGLLWKTIIRVAALPVSNLARLVMEHPTTVLLVRKIILRTDGNARTILLLP